MKTILLLLFFITIPVFSQKLWEIEHNPNDVVRDVSEIPNSDLLLFTYNSGKLEIRNSNDGSLVRNVIRPQGEKGGYNISGLGNSYYFSARGDYEPDKEETYVNDTIFVFDLFTDEIINRITFDVGQYKSQSNFINKSLKYNFTPDMTKVFGKIGYNFIDGPGFHFFYVYDINHRKIIYTEEVNRLRVSEFGEFTGPGFYLKSYRSSPDSKFLILNGMDNGDGKWDDPVGAAKMFNVELNEMSILMTNKNTSSEKLGALTSSNTRFLSNSKLISSGYNIYNFPNFNLVRSINLFADYGLHSVLDNESSICNNNLFCRVGERIENTQNKFYYYHIFLNYDDKNIILNTKNLQTSLEFSRKFLIKNCLNLIVVKDFDNREGIVTCYEFNTLDVEFINSNNVYFNKVDNAINFNSQEFIGQTASIEIYNSVGARVGTLYNGFINQPNYNFQIPELPSGAYYLQCQLPIQNLNFNFVVVR